MKRLPMLDGATYSEMFIDMEWQYACAVRYGEQQYATRVDCIEQGRVPNEAVLSHMRSVLNNRLLAAVNEKNG